MKIESLFERYPILLPLIGFTLGIVVAGFTDIGLTYAIVIGVIISASTIVSSFKWNAKAPIFFLLFLGFGYAQTTWQDQRFETQHFTHFNLETAQIYTGELLAYPVPTKRATRLEVALKADKTSTPISGNIYLYTTKSDSIFNLHPGDKILFKAKLNPIQPPKNPHEFDYRNYLHLNQIYAQTYSEELKIIPTETVGLARLTSQVRALLLTVIADMDLDPESQSVAAALLLGYRHYISDDTTRAFAGAGAMHVLAVSGLHVGILYIVTAFLLGIDRKKPHRNNWKKVLLTIAIIWGYATLTGLSASVTRAAVMFTFIAGGNLFKRKTASIQALIASALFLLAIKPNYLFEVGFQLSYAAVFGIIYLQPKIYHLFPRSRYWLVDKAWQITAVSFAAQAATFPLSMYYFHQFPVLFFVSNLFVIPLATITMYYGLLVLIISVFTGPVHWLIYPLELLLKAMINGVRWVENIPHSVIYKLWIGRFELVLLTLFIFMVAELIWFRRKRALVIATILAITLLAIDSSDNWAHKQQHKVTFYSVNNHTAIEIREGKKSVLLADSALLADEDAMLFHIKHNLWAGGIKQNESFELAGESKSKLHFKQQAVIDANELRILLFSEPSDSSYFSLKPDVIVVAGRIKAPTNVPDSATIILQNGLSKFYIDNWNEASTKIYDLTKSGAFELEVK